MAACCGVRGRWQREGAARRPPDCGAAATLSHPCIAAGQTGNLPPSQAMCLYQDALKGVVRSVSGWDFINEGTEEKPKKG